MRSIKRFIKWHAIARYAVRFIIALMVIGGMTALAAPTAHAKMQNKETCKTLKAERAALKQTGILDDIAKGPEWVTDNLSSEQIAKVKRYLVLNGTVMFQCPNGGKPAIKRKPTPVKKAGSRAKKKKIRKKTSNKKTSSLSFDPFASN